MAYTTSGSSLLNDVMPQIKQYKATTGRDMSPNIIQGLLQAKLKEEAAGAEAARRLDLTEQAQAQTKAYQDSQVELAQKKQKAAATQGLLTLPATAYGTVKSTQALYGVGKDALGYGAPAAAAGETATAAAGGVPMAGAPAYTGAATPALSYGSAAGEVGAGVAPQTAGLLSGTTGAASTGGAATAAGVTGAAEAGGAGAQIAAYDAALAEGAAQGVGTAATGTAAAAEGAAESTGLLGGSTAMTAAGYAGGGYLLGQAIKAYSPIGGKTEKSIASHVATGAGIGAAVGSYVPVIGTAIGGVIGGAVGAVTGIISNASVICSELLRQGKITEKDRKWAIQFKNRFISDEMFQAYLIWAKPYVEIMQRGGVGNDMLHDRMMAFVSYMINIAKDHGVTKYENEVYQEIWGECIEIALTNSERKVA